MLTVRRRVLRAPRTLRRGARALALLLVSPWALAQASVVSGPSTVAVDPARAPVSERRWYGWQAIVPDAAGAALLIGAGGDNSAGGQALYWPGLVLEVLSGPVVHAAHGRWGVAAAALGLRAGGALLGTLIGFGVGAALPCPKATLCVGPGVGFSGAAYGLPIGAGVGAILDDTLLAWERVPPVAPSGRLTWSPSLTPMKGGIDAGVVGTF